MCFVVCRHWLAAVCLMPSDVYHHCLPLWSLFALVCLPLAPPFFVSLLLPLMCCVPPLSPFVCHSLSSHSSATAIVAPLFRQVITSSAVALSHPRSHLLLLPLPPSAFIIATPETCLPSPLVCLFPIQLAVMAASLSFLSLLSCPCTLCQRRH
jgi:hypothetical protein